MNNNESLEILNLETENNSKFSVIDHYGEDLTQNEFVTNPAIGRDEEINQMILTLLTPDKGALLVGKAGIGKTALVEGLAYRIQMGNVPNVLKDWRIVKINIPSLLGESTQDGTTDSKIELLIQELKGMDKIILFIDEVHLLVNKQAGVNNIDFANMLKPALDRGTIKMVGATTTEEYEAYILRDRAFLRRFIRIDILESDPETVIKILMGTYPKFEQKMGVKLNYTDFQKEKIFRFIVDMTSEYKRVYEIGNRYPDVSLTVVASAFSYALFENSSEVKLKHFYQAIINTKNIYEDALIKEIAKFKEQFKDWIIEEGINLDEIK